MFFRGVGQPPTSNDRCDCQHLPTPQVADGYDSLRPMSSLIPCIERRPIYGPNAFHYAHSEFTLFVRLFVCLFVCLLIQTFEQKTY